jgi:hypothetical protein
MLKTVRKCLNFSAVLCLLTLGVVPSSVLAANGNPAYCDPEVDRLTNQGFQAKVPVILVHGISGKAQDWGSINNQTDFAGKINSIPGVGVAHIFNYNTFLPVNSPVSGPKLAKTIDCVSQLSRANGGKGKVIVIGYSLGGLVARDALSRHSTDGQRAIADEAGQVITIGTPHNLPLAPPQFPSQTVVHTIAGDVTRVFYNIWGNEVGRSQPHDDTLVSTESALAEHSNDINKGGGQKTLNCEKRYLQLNLIGIAQNTAPCEHGQLISNASNGVREDTVEAITKYVASLSSVSLTIGSLTTTYDSRWTQVAYGA